MRGRRQRTQRAATKEGFVLLRKAICGARVTRRPRLVSAQGMIRSREYSLKEGLLLAHRAKAAEQLARWTRSFLLPSSVTYRENARLALDKQRRVEWDSTRLVWGQLESTSIPSCSLVLLSRSHEPVVAIRVVIVENHMRTVL